MKRIRPLMERIRNRTASIIEGPGRAPFFSIENLLLVFSKVYGGVLCLRRHLYERGVLASASLSCRVISIGNIVAGGTGKTPMTVFVARLLRDMGLRVTVVSRGYKGTMEAEGGVVSDGRTIFKGPGEAGDEPYLIARLLPEVAVIVGRDRHRSGQLAIERFDAQVVVLDDGFQHLRLQRDMDLVLLDGRSPLGNGQLLPRGALREPPSALRRAQAIVYTRCVRSPASIRPTRLSSQIPCFFTIHHPIIRHPRAVGDPFIRQHADIRELRGRHVLAFAGLADTAQFFESLEGAGCILEKTIAFADHHHYSDADLGRIAQTAKEIGADILVTTLKDFVKVEIYDRWPIPLVVVDAEIHFKGGDTSFRKLLVDWTVKKFKA